jgi:hypothetical protein
MTHAPGFYWSAHDVCRVFRPHRHPAQVVQPHEYTVELPAVVTFRFSVDEDGTVRITSGSYGIKSQDIRGISEVEDWATFKPVYGLAEGVTEEEGNARWEALLDAVDTVAEGELPVHDRWPEQRAPILDEAEA